MSTTETPPNTPSSPAPSSSTPSQPSNPAPSDATPPSTTAPAQAPQADGATPGKDGGTPAKAPAEGDLLFNKDKPGEQKPSEPAKLTPAEQKQYLLDKKVDPKTLEGKTDEEIAKLFDDAKAAETAPQKIEYKDFDVSKAPEGVEIAADQMDWLKKYGQDNNLTQEQAQALVDKGIEMQQKNLDFWNETKAGWRDQVKKDPELGGQNLAASVAAAEAVISKFGGTPDQIKEMQDDLMLLGLGNKRSFIRFCNNINKATKDDSANTPSGGGSKPQQTLAQKMWPNMPGDKK